MSKTAIEVIAATDFPDHGSGSGDPPSLSELDAGLIITALDAADFAIVPKTLNKAQEKQIPLGWSVIQMHMVYNRLIASGRATSSNEKKER